MLISSYPVFSLPGACQYGCAHADSFSEFAWQLFEHGSPLVAKIKHFSRTLTNQTEFSRFLAVFQGLEISLILSRTFPGFQAPVRTLTLHLCHICFIYVNWNYKLNFKTWLWPWAIRKVIISIYDIIIMIGAQPMLTYTVLYTYVIFVMWHWSPKGLCGLVVRMLDCRS